MEEPSETLEPIQASALDDDNAFVWDTAGAARLRQRCRLVCPTVTALPEALRNDDSPALPAILTKEQLRLSRASGWVSLSKLSDERQAPEHAAAGQAACGGMDWKEASQQPRAEQNNTSAARSLSEGVQHDRRCRVFTDLHAKGYFITSGSKFGADFLLYLGDPVEQHAVACVRVIDPHMPPSPVMLAGAVRSAFGARKDLLLATVAGDPPAVHYLTLTPEPSVVQVDF